MKKIFFTVATRRPAPYRPKREAGAGAGWEEASVKSNDVLWQNRLTHRD